MQRQLQQRQQQETVADEDAATVPERASFPVSNDSTTPNFGSSGHPAVPPLNWGWPTADVFLTSQHAVCPTRGAVSTAGGAANTAGGAVSTAGGPVSTAGGAVNSAVAAVNLAGGAAAGVARDGVATTVNTAGTEDLISFRVNYNQSREQPREEEREEERVQQSEEKPPQRSTDGIEEKASEDTDPKLLECFSRFALQEEEEEEKVFIANSKGMVWMMDTSLHPNAKLRPE